MTDSFGRSALRNVSRETTERLNFFAAKVEKWNPAINLVSKLDLKQVFDRHILDSLQLLDHAPAECHHWVDLGSGGGFPGLVIGIAMIDVGYPTKLTLVESDLRKAVFLREVARELDLSVAVIDKRIESTDGLEADVLSARALAPLVKLCEFANRHLKPNGKAIFPKGSNFQTEIDEARHSWSFDLNIWPSHTSESGAILTLSELTHV